jgi:general secretion pathway protein A
MYESFYKFDILPFENTPNPRFFFASEHHREALAAIEYTVRMRKGIVLVTGDVGSGKTTVCKTVQSKCANSATVVELMHGYTSGIEFTRHLLRTVNVPFEDDEEHSQLLARLGEFLLEQARVRQPVVLFIDEAQALSDEVLEEIRLLTNFDTAGEKLIQLALVGHPELRDRIASHNLSALRQRIVMAKRLRPFNRQETAAYIQHRLRAASLDPNNIAVEFTPRAIETIFDYTGGIPRLTNIACDNCLLLGYVRETRQITPVMVQRVIADMVPSFAQAGIHTTEAAQSPRLSIAGNF